MKRRHKALTTLAAAVLLAAGARAGFAFGGRGHHMGGGPPFMGAAAGTLPLPVLVSVMTPAQRGQLRDVMQGERAAMKGILDQLRAAQEELIGRLLTPGALTAADLQPQLQKVAGLRDQLVQHALGTTLKVRALLTPDQLSEAATKMKRLHDLRSEMRGLLGGPSAGDDDAPE
jgi:Spy/CpxP family protein refolding chaperone